MRVLQGGVLCSDDLNGHFVSVSFLHNFPQITTSTFADIDCIHSLNGEHHSLIASAAIT